jgi:hypothetical protein
MTPPPTSIDGTDITGATIDGQQVQEITIDGQTVFTAAPEIPPSGEARWTFDNADTQNGIAKDVWGTADGQIFGNPTTGVTGKFGEAYSFDGVDDRVDNTGSNTSDFEAWTVAIWFNPDSDTGDSVLYNEGNTWWIQPNQNSGDILFKWKDSGGSQGEIVRNSALSANAWHLVGMSFDGAGTMTARIDDNAFKDQTSGISTPLDRSQGFDIQISGLKGGQIEIKGQVDQADYYEKVLSDAEWSNLFNTGDIRG